MSNPKNGTCVDKNSQMRETFMVGFRGSYEDFDRIDKEKIFDERAKMEIIDVVISETHFSDFGQLYRA